MSTYLYFVCVYICIHTCIHTGITLCIYHFFLIPVIGVHALTLCHSGLHHPQSADSLLAEEHKRPEPCFAGHLCPWLCYLFLLSYGTDITIYHVLMPSVLGTKVMPDKPFPLVVTAMFPTTSLE